MFEISKKEKRFFKYVGLNIEQNGDKYLKINKHMWMDFKTLQFTKKEKQLDNPLLEKEKQQLTTDMGYITDKT